MDEFKGRLKELIKISANKSLSEEIKQEVYNDFIEDYNPYNKEPLSTIQDANTGEYIIKDPLGGLMTVKKHKMKTIHPEYKYFTDEEIFFMRTGSYDIVRVEKEDEEE